MKQQPAEKSYVFDKAYRDVAHAFSVTWGQTFDRAGIKRMFSSPLLWLPNLVVFLVITAFRVIVNTVISLFLTVAFLVAAPFVYIGFVIVAFFDFLYRTIKRISCVCPVCQFRFDLPTYLCPSCSRRHTRLVPGKYGVFKRKCLCGKKLPTTFFNGRQKLHALCPKCGYATKDGGRRVDVCIPVIGGSGAGKTCYINMAIASLGENPAVQARYTYSYLSGNLNDHQEIVDSMKRGYLPEKTSDMRLKYYQFYLTPKAESVKRLISVCDVGGEIYSDAQLLGAQIGFRYANGFLMVIDPLSVSLFKKEVEKKVNLSKYGASADTVDEIFNRFVLTLENLYGASSQKSLKLPVAVVITKCDIPGLDERIGKGAVDAYLRSHSVTKEEALNTLCESFLRSYAEDNFVNSIKAKFKSVQFFSCNSLEGIRGAISSSGVGEPLLWLIENSKKTSNM